MLNIFKKTMRPIKVVDLTNPTFHAILGNYFIGQTEEIAMQGSNNAWAALINPPDSRVNLFFDIFTINNWSQLWYAGLIALAALYAIDSTLISLGAFSYQYPNPAINGLPTFYWFKAMYSNPLYL